MALPNRWCRRCGVKFKGEAKRAMICPKCNRKKDWFRK